MDTRPKPHKRTHLKHSSHRTHNEAKDQSWLRRFLLALGFVAALAVSVIFYYTRDRGTDDEQEQDVYVSVKVTPVFGTGELIICQLSLLIDSEQEKGIQSRQSLLEAVVSQSLLDSYQRTQRPDLHEVRQNLYLAINQKLPRKLQIRDVLIQELKVGLR
jgi:hypothetical protein